MTTVKEIPTQHVELSLKRITNGNTTSIQTTGLEVKPVQNETALEELERDRAQL